MSRPPSECSVGCGMAGINVFICERTRPWHTQAVNTLIEPEKQNRIVLTREISNVASGFGMVIP